LIIFSNRRIWLPHLYKGLRASKDCVSFHPKSDPLLGRSLSLWQSGSMTMVPLQIRDILSILYYFIYWGLTIPCIQHVHMNMGYNLLLIYLLHDVWLCEHIILQCSVANFGSSESILCWRVVSFKMFNITFE